MAILSLLFLILTGDQGQAFQALSEKQVNLFLEMSDAIDKTEVMKKYGHNPHLNPEKERYLMAISKAMEASTEVSRNLVLTKDDFVSYFVACNGDSEALHRLGTVMFQYAENLNTVSIGADRDLLKYTLVQVIADDHHISPERAKEVVKTDAKNYCLGDLKSGSFPAPTPQKNSRNFHPATK